MRETFSSHKESIRNPTRASSSNFELNVDFFRSRLAFAAKDGAIVKSKRKAIEVPDERRSSKRTRTAHGSRSGSDDGSEEPQAEVQYPFVGVGSNCPSPGAEIAPVLRHVFEIQYVTEDPVEDALTEKEESLRGLIQSLSVFNQTITLGPVLLGEHGGRVICVSEDHMWLLPVPALTINGDSGDLVKACRILQAAGQVHLEGLLRIAVCPQDAQFSTLSIYLELQISLILPAVLENSIPRRMSKRERPALEDARRRLLHTTYLSHDASTNNAINVSSFYSILQPAPALPSTKASNALQPEGLQATLLPFQRRSLAWLLAREGMAVTSEGDFVVQKSARSFTFWTEVKEGNHTWYLNRLSGELVEDEPESPVIYGGMLAEEPGLGKTVEIIALVLSNPAPPDWNPSLSRWDANSRLDVKAIKTTLIVTPPSLAIQWKDELTKHSPCLKVLLYNGWTKLDVPITAAETQQFLEKKASENKPKKAFKNPSARSRQKAAEKDKEADDAMMKDENGNMLEWCDYVHQFDVVITTYSILRSEIHVARPGPDRPQREDSAYSSYRRPRSPLVMVEWKRVVMDEVQMVGGGSAAEMVSLVPRLSSFAVSGTPAKSQISDLIHVLKFLRVDQLVGDLRMWNRLLQPAFAKDFTALLQYYGIRTTKSSVAAELTIPEQTRYLVGVELGKVERHVYDQTLERMLLDLGLDARGVAATSNWQVDSGLLRTLLRRLRGICTHPQVGQLQRKGDNIYKPGALKTMDAVLETMRDQSWKNVMEDWKTKIQLLIRIAQLKGQDDSVPRCHQDARESLALAEKESKKYLNEIKDSLAKHDVNGKQLKEEAALLRHQQQHETPPGPDADDDHYKGKGKAVDDKDEEGGEEDPEERGLPKTPAGEEHRTKRRALVQRLREGHIVLHRVNFLQGDVYHVLGNSELEDSAYQAAEALRRQLLKGSEDEANKAVALLTSSAAKKNLNRAGMLVQLPLLGKGGIKSAYLMEEANSMIDEVLNEQSELLWEWRLQILNLLSQPLNKTDSDADGQEYQRNLDDQGEAETYMQAYAALLADRREALTNERTLLAAHDVREKQLRHTKAAMKAVAAAEDSLDIPDGLDLQPEHEVLHTELSGKRKEIILALKGRSIKSITVDLNAVHVKIANDKDPEKIIAKNAVDTIRRFVSEQNSLYEKLENDLTVLRRSFNQRILYFRQLQEISDSVAEVEWEEESVAAAVEVCMTEKAELDAKINTARARHRYIDNLSQNHDTTNPEEDEKECVLCRCEFSRGYFTHCGHVFCELCMKAWLYKKANKTCPVCRVAINVDTMQRFATNAQALKTELPPKIVAGEAAPQSHRTITYNMIDPATFEEIQRMETMGDFGSKVQTLVRHLAHIKLTDPGSKSIVFSAWADSLHIVEQALRANRIQSLRIDNGTKHGSATHRFTTDPEISVLLLHGERENAGLNVTCASRVFLLESVVHHSFEIQAIARIDRLGQTRPTEVYCYYAEETIERNILDLAARKGLSLYTKDNSKGTVSVSSFNQEIEQAIDDSSTKKKTVQKGDFIYKVDDMLAILFPHMFEELEYLLPATLENQGGSMEDIEMVDDYTTPQFRMPRASTLNAVAGPSRLG